MGLLDIFNGMNNGPRGQAGSSAKGGGMSPITMGLLALLAYKALKGSASLGNILGSGTSGANPGGVAPPKTTAGPVGFPSGDASLGGGLVDMLRGGLGSMFAGGAAGSILSGGLGELLKQFQQNGHGEVAQSWVGTGPNRAIAPNDLAKAIGADTLDALSQQSGMPREQLLTELSERLPETVDSLTPEGRIPTEQEASRMA